MRTKRAVRWTSLATLLALISAGCTTNAPVETTTTVVVTAPPRVTTSTNPPKEECPSPFCVKYNIHSDAAWADGTPVTANDFAFTFETIMNGQLDIRSRDGYDMMRGYEIVDQKTFVAIFDDLYGPWQSLFDAIVPEHELRGRPFNSYWDDLITLGSGPFTMREWIKGEHIVMERNQNYWASEDRASGEPLGDVQTITIEFEQNFQTQLQALRDREIDMVYFPQPELTLVDDLEAIENFEGEAGLGAVWEHIDFNLDDPLLSQLFVRQAIATGIDRDAIVEAVVRPIAASAVPLGNTVWLTTSSNYEDHFGQYTYDPVKAEAYLTDNGCVKGADGIYECDGQRLSFNWTTTTGSEERELQFVFAQANLADIGIEVNSTFLPPSEIFKDEFFFGDSTMWQMLDFGWVGSPDPVRFNTIFYCEGDTLSGFGELNVTRYCNDEIDQLVHATDVEVDPAARASLYNRADALYLADVPSIPMYQKPTFLAWSSDISGPKINTTQVGTFWNVSSWVGKEVINFSTDEEPEAMNIFESGSRGPAIPLVAMILEGAFTVAPDLSYVPVLVTSVELMVADP